MDDAGALGIRPHEAGARQGARQGANQASSEGDVLDTRWPRALLIAFCLLVWLPGFFTLPPTDRDESRFVQASRQMIETGDYVRIMNGDEPRNRKPIGIHWLQAPLAAAARAAGVATAHSVWPYRLPSAAGALLAVLATYEIGLAMGGRRAALFGACGLGASVILVTEAHLAKTDAALIGVTTVAMAVLARAYAGQPVGRGRAAVFWLAMGAGILLKGPITPMVAGLAAVTLAVADRRGRWLLALRPLSGIALTLLVVVPWFVAIGLATHGAFFSDAVGGDLGRKLASGDDAHGAPPGLHLVLLPLLAFPLTLPVLRSLPAWWRMRRAPAERFLLAWIVPAWLVFEATPTKLPHYTLPLYPAIFLLAARAWDAFPALPAGWWGRWAAPGLTAAAAAVLAIGAVALPFAVHADPWLGVPALLAACLAGWLALQASHRPALALAAMPLFTAAVLGWELPHAAPLWLAPQVEQALVDAHLAERPLVAVGFHEPSLMFEAGTTTVMAATGTDGARALADHQAASAIVAAADAPSFRDEAARLGLHLAPLTTLRGFNYSRGRVAILTLYGPAPP